MEQVKTIQSHGGEVQLLDMVEVQGSISIQEVLGQTGVETLLSMLMVAYR